MTMTRGELQDAARKAFGESVLAPDADKSWSMIAEMGWLMMTVPEAQGGLGLGLEAAAAIHFELGRALVPGPAIAQMMVIEALSAAGQEELLSQAMAGEVMTADLGAVVDADRASHMLVLGEATSLVLLNECSITHREGWDNSRRLFDVIPGAAPGISLGDCSVRVQRLMLAALAADSLGGADALLELTVDYLKTRRQFDRPIAMFQALKHRCADMKVKLAAAEALLWSRVCDPHVTLAQLGALKAHATAAYNFIAEESIQLHGGIGLTDEHPCHLFFKRAMLNANLGGDTDYWDELAGRSLLGG